MKIISSVCSLIVLFYLSSALAVNKVVVIPLLKCGDGLVNCSGKCVDTMNNPNFCGGCTTDCGAGNNCSNGQCKNKVGTSCTNHAECMSGLCGENVCTVGKFVFASSVSYTGDLGGLAGADSKCQVLAGKAALPGTYKAWLSDLTDSPSTRFSHLMDYLPYFRVDGKLVASNWDDLTDGELKFSLSADEYGSPRQTGPWTGTAIDGTRATQNEKELCGNWVSPSDGFGELEGITGISTETSGLWTNDVPTGCTNERSLYCFQEY